MYACSYVFGRDYQTFSNLQFHEIFPERLPARSLWSSMLLLLFLTTEKKCSPLSRSSWSKQAWFWDNKITTSFTMGFLEFRSPPPPPCCCANSLYNKLHKKIASKQAWFWDNKITTFFTVGFLETQLLWLSRKLRQLMGGILGFIGSNRKSWWNIWPAFRCLCILTFCVLFESVFGNRKYGSFPDFAVQRPFSFSSSLGASWMGLRNKLQGVSSMCRHSHKLLASTSISNSILLHFARTVDAGAWIVLCSSSCRWRKPQQHICPRKHCIFLICM